jgi:hypothetical protein
MLVPISIGGWGLREFAVISVLATREWSNHSPRSVRDEDVPRIR